MTMQTNEPTMHREPITRGAIASAAVALAFASLAAFIVQEADARGPGGAIRGGGAMGLSRGGSGGFNRPTAGSAQRNGTSGRQRATSNGQRPTGDSTQRTQLEGQDTRAASSSTAASNNGAASTTFGNGNGNPSAAGNGNGNTGATGNGNGNGNTGVINNGTVNTGDINSGNVNVGNDVEVNVGNGGWNGSYSYPAGATYARGVAVGTTATVATIGSYYSSLPAGCSPYVWNSHRYYSCSGAWYQTRYVDNRVTYVVVANPTMTK